MMAIIIAISTDFTKTQAVEHPEEEVLNCANGRNQSTRERISNFRVYAGYCDVLSNFLRRRDDCRRPNLPSQPPHDPQRPLEPTSRQKHFEDVSKSSCTVNHVSWSKKGIMKQQQQEKVNNSTKKPGERILSNQTKPDWQNAIMIDTKKGWRWQT